MRTTVAARGWSAPDQDSGRGRCIDEGIGEAHRAAGGRPQVCINFKMMGQMLEKRGIAAFAKSVADRVRYASPPRRVASQPITRDQPLRPRRNAFDPWTRSFRDHRDGRKRMTENAAVVVGVDGSEGSSCRIALVGAGGSPTPTATADRRCWRTRRCDAGNRL